MFGIPDHEALLCMTRNAAMTLPQHRDKIGTLTTGKYADVLIVEGRPDEDVRVLQDKSRLRMNMQEGNVITAWRQVDAER
jgi:imidazolonepropionase-like amidohydrolase